MRKIWVLLGGLLLGSTPATSAETDKAAAREASSEADKWAASVKQEKPKPPQETKPASPATPVTASPAATPPAETPPAATPPAATLPGVTTPVEKKSTSPALSPVKRVGLNEMKGKLLSKSYDPKAIRLIVAGNFNVEFTYDQKTVLINGGKSISIDDLSYNDEIVVRYAGKDLYAIEIDRLSRAPRPE